MRRAPGNDLILGHLAESDAQIVLSKTQRDKHLYVCGSTGTGKSKFLDNCIRQDIRNWHRSRSGLLLLDPHGSLYDSLIRWLASREIDRPIIPIDLRRDDWVIGYNALRRRDNSDPAVVVNNFVQAMAFVWGQTGTDQTPLFARWATNILMALYESGNTLIESEHLISHSSKRIRSMMTKGLKDRMARRDWEYASHLSPVDFESQISSTVNRLRPFLGTKLTRQMFGQNHASLDLAEALREGHIILVNLATERGRVSDEDSALFATLLLSDLWAEAKARGKEDDRNPVKPFYVYCDEFQNFITPTIAKNLDQARGFGLHLTLAHQFPNQILHAGAHGKQVYDSVMENARTKVVFAIESEENLRPMAQALFRHVMSPDRIRREVYSTKILGYQEQSRTATSQSKTSSKGSSSSFGTAKGAGSGGTIVYTGDAASSLADLSDLTSASESDSAFASSSESEGEFESISSGESSSTFPVQIPTFGRELASAENEPLESQLYKAMAILSDQQQRHFVTRLVGEKVPNSLKTPTIPASYTSQESVSRFIERQFSKWKFALHAEQAENEIAIREGALVSEAALNVTGEATTSKRKISKA